MRLAERFSDLVDELDDHLKGDVVIERRLLQPGKRLKRTLIEGYFAWNRNLRLCFSDKMESCPLPRRSRRKPVRICETRRRQRKTGRPSPRISLRPRRRNSTAPSGRVPRSLRRIAGIEGSFVPCRRMKMRRVAGIGTPSNVRGWIAPQEPLAPGAKAGLVFGLCLKPPFLRNGTKGVLQRNGSAGKGAPGLRVHLDPCPARTARNTLVSEEKGAAVLGVLLRAVLLRVVTRA